MPHSEPQRDARPDVRVDPVELDAAGAGMAAAGAAVAAAARAPLGPDPGPDGFGSVAATALLATRWRAALARTGSDVAACGEAMRAAAAAWRSADAAVTASLRAD